MNDTDPRLIILNPDDSVAVARCAIPAGEVLEISGKRVALAAALTMGHKLARRTIAPGENILKYGVSIGSATADIAIGDHVHLSNMKSDYTPTYALTADGEVA